MLHRIIDPQHQGLPVAAFEHPDDWQAGSRVQWNLQDTSHPVTVGAACWNPAGRESFEFLPVEPCYWLQPNWGFERVGSKKLGLTLLPPASAVETMSRWLLPRLRGQALQFRIVGIQPLPDLARMVRAAELEGIPTEGVCARIEYVEQGCLYEEELCACKYEFAPQYGAITQINWGLTRIFSYRAEKGRLDSVHPTFRAIASSLYYNPQWQNLFQQITAELNGQFVGAIEAGFNKLRDEAQFQEQLISYYQEQRDRQSASVAWSVERQRQLNAERQDSLQSAQDAASDAALMGRTAYHDPNNAEGNYHYDHGHHDYVWTDGQGNFQATNDPNFDPNLKSDRSWSLARKATEPNT